MSTENIATAERTYGRWEREANDTVIFISEQGRRIRFRYSTRYTGMSLQYPSATVYQCTQCPLTALMINYQFRIVDPCAVHDCFVGAGHSQWTPPTDDAAAAVGEQQSRATTPQASSSSSPAKKALTDSTTAVSAQQSPATNVLASRSSSAIKNAPKVIAKAVYDVNGRVHWPSERYPGITFTFHSNKSEYGRRRHFYCYDCRRMCDKYTSCLKTCGLSRRYLIISGDSIVDCHPDDALEKAAAQAATNITDFANSEDKDGNSTQLMPFERVIEVAAESSEFDIARGRSLDKRPRASGDAPYEDKSFGKILEVPVSILTEAERLEWSNAWDIGTGLLRGKKLVAYHSKQHQRLFKFIRAGSGPSSLDKYAFDYFCLDCWMKHGEERRVTVHGWTQEFIITDPDRPSSGRHACVQASSARPSGSPAFAKKQLSGLVNAEAGSLHSDVLPVVETTAKSVEYFSTHYEAKLKFVLINKGRNDQVYYVCAKCRTLQRKMKEIGYQRFGCSEIRLHLVVVVGGKFERHPDECGVKLFTGDTVECRHICLDNKFKKLLHVDGAMCEDRRQPSPKRKRDATHGSGSEVIVATGLQPQSINVSRALTSQHDGSDRTATDQRVGAQSEQSHPRDSAADQAATADISETTTTTRNEGSSRRHTLDFGPDVDALDEALQYPESTYSVGSTAHYAGSRADTPHPNMGNVSATLLVADDGLQAHCFDEQHQADIARDSNNPTPTTLQTGAGGFAGFAGTSGTRKSCVGSPVDVKPPTKKCAAELITISDSDDDADANGTFSATGSASMKPVKREPVESTEAERRQEDPASKFHRFLEEFGFVNEYVSYSVYDSGEPTAFVQRPHVLQKWIKFNQRN